MPFALTSIFLRRHVNEDRFVMKKLCTLIFLTFISVGLLHGIGSAETPAAGENEVKARITVDPGNIIGQVNPLVFGHGIEAAKIPGWKENQAIETGRGLWDPQAKTPLKSGVEISRELGIKMLRYPGGGLVQGFHWKDASGPLSERPDKKWTFGVDEFLTFCKEIDAEPLMQVSYYTGTPQDAADLVKYLNWPESSKDPWVQKRIRAGHPKPYGVKYFEYGNETDMRGTVPDEYANKFNQAVKLMKKADPTINVSAHLASLSLVPSHPWNRTVIEKTRDTADFFVIHFYISGRGTDDDVSLRACMAAGEQIEQTLQEYNDIIKKIAGKPIPLAITEYNSSDVPEGAGKTHRFSLAAGLFNADLMRMYLKPENNIAFANYWQYLHGYWGIVSGPRTATDKQDWKRWAPFYCLRLWGEHFGDKLVDVSVDSPTLKFEGAGQTESAGMQKGKYEKAVPFTLTPSSGSGYTITPTGKDSLVLKLNNLPASTNPGLGNAAAKPYKTYILSCEAKSSRSKDSLAEVNVGIGMLDSRGWGRTYTGCAVEGLYTRDKWTKFETEPMTITAGGNGIGMILRPRVPGDIHTNALPAKTGHGEILIRNIRVLEISNAFPAYPVITASASLSRDGKTLYLIVFNKHHTDAVTTAIDIKDNSLHAAKCWTVTGPNLAATNMEKKEVIEVQANPSAESLKPSGFTYTFPPRSMNAIEITRK